MHRVRFELTLVTLLEVHDVMVRVGTHVYLGFVKEEIKNVNFELQPMFSKSTKMT